MRLSLASEGLRADEIANVEKLTEEVCWSFLRSETIGRLAVSTGIELDIFPVNYLVTGEEIFIRSAPGSKLVDIADGPEVAFEIDGRKRRTRWSVVVKGLAKRISYDDEIHESGVLDLHTLTSSTKLNYVRITPLVVTGRRFDIR